MKLRILFVDDEPNVLSGLRRMLRSRRHEWDMSFASSGDEALSMMADSPFDVVVSDMRMPGMDGSQLLSQVQARYPDAVRIILSGQSDEETVLRAVGPTHQYLAKPCDADSLKEAIERTRGIRSLLVSDRLKGLASRLPNLPSLPTIYGQVVEEINSPDPSIQRIGDLISSDVGMASKVLQLVNSAFFGLPRQISSASEAASLLGVDTLRSLILSAQVFSQLEGARSPRLSADSLWRHSGRVSAAARAICHLEQAPREHVETAAIGGMLHDAGKVLLAVNLPEVYAGVLEAGHEVGTPVHRSELEILGATHAEVGAYLLALWALPGELTETLAYHHTPSQSADRQFSSLTAVHVANALAHSVDDGKARHHELALDTGYLDRLGLSDRIPEWTRAVSEMFDHEGEG